jgi:Na+-driven multidrug efflux pump
MMVAITAVVERLHRFVPRPALQALGAGGEVAQLAQRYLAITVHSLPLLGIGIASAALLRAVGTHAAPWWSRCRRRWSAVLDRF